MNHPEESQKGSKKARPSHTNKVNIYMGAPDQLVLKSAAGEIVCHIPDFSLLACDCICHCNCGVCECYCDCACVCNCDCDCCVTLRAKDLDEFYAKVKGLAETMNVRFGEIQEILEPLASERE
jgi:hypothetical protein